MKTRIIVSTVVAFIVAGNLFFHADPFSLLVSGGLAAVLCFVPLLILSRFRFVESAAGSMQTLVCVLICMLALSVFLCMVMSHRISTLQYDLNHHWHTSDSPVESSPDSPQEQSGSQDAPDASGLHGKGITTKSPEM